jgi:hypothetical protein
MDGLKEEKIEKKEKKEGLNIIFSNFGGSF